MGGATNHNTVDSNSQWMEVAGEITHPQHRGSTLEHDMMIVKLDTEVANHNVRVIGLAGDVTPE